MSKSGELAGGVYQTKNYKMFKNNKLQREHHSNTQAYAGIESLLLTYGWWVSEPMIVNPRGKDNLYEIVKGHNKFEIAKKHNLPVYYQIEPMRIPIWMREGGRGSKGVKWSKNNFVQSWIKEGSNPAYTQVNHLMDKTRMSLSSCVALLNTGRNGSGRTGSVWDTIEDGTYAIGDSSHAEIVGNLVIFCRKLEIPLAAKDNFVRALSLLIRSGAATPTELSKRINRNRSILMRKVAVTDYLALLQEVYNRGYSPRADLKITVTNYIESVKKERTKKMMEARKIRSEEEAT
jgi:hypothetical protein